MDRILLMVTPETGSEVANLFDTTSEDLLNKEERAMLSTLLSSSDRVDMAIPENISESDLWATLSICGRVLVPIRRASTQLKVIIGRIVHLIQQRPEVYESRGFRSFDAFMSDAERGMPAMTGISRAELFKARATANGLGPSINMEDVRQVGITKIGLIAGVTSPGSATQKALMEAAKTDTIPELRERIARSSLNVQAGDIEWDLLQVTMTKSQKQFAQQFFNNPRVQSYCSSTSPGMIMEMMIQELQEEWQVRAMVVEGESRGV